MVRPQLFSSCHLRPRGARLLRRANYMCGPDDIQVQFVFYSPFEPMVLPGGGPMEAMGVQKLYEPSPMPILYVGLVADVLGRVPWMPLFLLGNSTPTIPHSSASTGAPGFHMGWQMQPVSRAGREAMWTRSTNGCGSLAQWAGQTASGGPVGG